MACTIKEFMDDILYEDVTAQLRTGFVTQFGREFVAGSYDCEADKPSVEIDSFSCDQNDDARSCRNWRYYVSSKSWLEATATDTVNLLTDIAALTDGRLRSDLESLKSSLASVMESTPNRLDAAIRDELFNSSARENADPRARDVFFEPRRPSNSRQQWEMKKKESTDKGDIFVLANLRNGGVLTYDNGLHMRTEARTRGDDSQHFLLRPTDREGVYYIFNIHKKRYLDSSDADGSYRPSLTTKELDGRKTIKWRVRRGHNGYLIINDVLGLALSI
jgi:hypothetical protein